MEADALEGKADGPDGSLQRRSEPTAVEPARQLQLPRIVAFGAHNAGKSSVLEAISGINFPIDFGSHARFVTELLMNSGPEFCVTTCVRFADQSKGVKHLHTGLSFGDIQRVIDESRVEMHNLQSGPDFSENVLGVYITGPELFPLWLVDLPGALPVDPALEPAQAALIERVANGYLGHEYGIILPVVSADQDLDALKAVVDTAARYDLGKKRTLGIITKPDCATESSRPLFLNISRRSCFGYQSPFDWHVLYTQPGKQTQTTNRYESELDFFRHSVWHLAADSNLGAIALHKKLSDGLFECTRAQIPARMQRLQMLLNKSWQERHGLGPEPSERNMLSFLLNTASEFQRLSREAALGNYDDDFFRTGGDASKLHKRLRCHHSAFEYMVQDYSPVHNIVKDGFPHGHDRKPHSNVLQILESNPYSIAKPQRISYHTLCAELDTQVAGSGRSGGHAKELFMRFSANWKDLALQYVAKILYECKAFVEFVFRYLVPSSLEKTTDAILCSIVDPFFEECETTLESKIYELIEPYEQGYGLPSEDDIFDIVIEKARKREPAEIKKNAENFIDGSSGHGSCGSKTPAIVKAIVGQSREDNSSSQHIIDVTESFYETSQTIFTDNIINLAVERLLVRRLWTLFTPQMVCDMSAEQLREIATEAPHVQTRRRVLEQEIEALEAELKYWRRFRPTKAYFNFVLPAEEQVRAAMNTVKLAPVKEEAPISEVKDGKAPLSSAAPIDIACDRKKKAPTPWSKFKDAQKSTSHGVKLAPASEPADGAG